MTCMGPSRIRARAWPARSPAWRAAARAVWCSAGPGPSSRGRHRKSTIAAGISDGRLGRPLAAAYPAAACRLARSVSSQAAACPAWTAAALAGRRLAGGSEGLRWYQDGNVLAGGQRGVQVVVQQPAGGGVAVGGVVGGREGLGVLAEQVVQPVAAAGGFGEQVLVVEALQAAAGSRPGWCRRARRRRRRRCRGPGAGPAGGTAAADRRSGPGRTGRTRRRPTGSPRCISAEPVPGRGQVGGQARGVQAGWWCSWLASIPIASGRYPHSRVISPTPASSAARPGRPASRASRSAASSGAGCRG